MQSLRAQDAYREFQVFCLSFVIRYRPVPSYTSAAKKEDFKAAAIFDEMEKTLKGVRNLVALFLFRYTVKKRLSWREVAICAFKLLCSCVKTMLGSI